MTTRTRRQVLAGTVTLGATGLAGCVVGRSEDDDAPENDSANGSGQPDAAAENGGNQDAGANADDDSSSGDDTVVDATVVDAALESSAVSCGGAGDDTSDVSVADSTVRVTGSFGGLSTPCHEVVLGDVAVVDGVLSVDLGVDSTADPDEACAQCISEATYEVTVELDAPIDSENVRVTNPPRS